MTLESNKNLGGVGAILMVIGTLPFVGLYSGVIGFIGLILVLIAMNGLSGYYKDAAIFNNVLYGVITAIVGGIIFIAIFITGFVGLLESVGITDWTDWAALQRIQWGNITWDTVAPYVGAILLSAVLLFVFLIVTAVFLRRSLNTLADKTRVGMFRTAGTLTMIGAVLTIALIGFLLLWIALILLAVAFFSIRLEPAPQTPPPPPAQQ